MWQAGNSFADATRLLQPLAMARRIAAGAAGTPFPYISKSCFA